MRRFFTLLLLLVCTLSFYEAPCQTSAGLQNMLVSDGTDLPPTAKKITSIRVSVSPGKTYDQAIEKAGKRAGKKKGNTIVIQKVKYPVLFRSNIIIEADVFYLEHVGDYIANRKRMVDSVLKSQIPENAPYALLYVFRPKSYYGSAIKFNLHVNDSIVCRVKNGHRYNIKLTQTGPTKIWSRTEARETIDADIQPGKVYYLNCAVVTGLFVGRPSFYMATTYYGIEELIRQQYMEETNNAE